MASHVKSIDFLPEIFRTKINQQFLSSTLDQLVQEPRLKKIQGFIGHRTGVGVNLTDDYLLESTNSRSNYQLEPGVVFFNNDTTQANDATSYAGIVNSIKQKHGKVNNHNRLFESEFYTWDPFVDFDKFVNFNQYYWMPSGPDPVDVYAEEWPISDEFTVSRNSDGFNISERKGVNPTITLVRGGSYKFLTNQAGHEFYIQATPGPGIMPYAKNQSNREIFGVTNNGEDAGTITFNVPEKNAQNFYFTLLGNNSVDVATNLKFSDINNIFVSEFISKHKSIDGIADLDGRTVIFLNKLTGSSSGWYNNSQYDHAANWSNNGWDSSTEITSQDDRYSIWKIQYVYDANGANPYMTLTKDVAIPKLHKVNVTYGNMFGGLTYYRDVEGFFARQPLISAPMDILYYQDSMNPDMFGVIKLVDIVNKSQLAISDIIGKQTYTSPNGIVFSNGMKVRFRNNVIPLTYVNQEYYVEGVGESIVLLPVTDFITPELYVIHDDSTQNSPTVPDYMTINRASRDQNAWSRSNRWVHIDVILATSIYNNTNPTIDNNNRAKRPILEFLPSLRLFNSGIDSVGPVSIIDFSQTDALSNINNNTSYIVDGYELADGDTIIFAADTDVNVVNKMYRVDFVNLTNSGSNPSVINLVQVDTLYKDQTIISLNGNTTESITYWFNGKEWQKAQQKTSVNQPPLFDVFDRNENSFSDVDTYYSSTFRGSKLFSYASSVGTDDPVLGIPLKYYSLSNIGDITFNNNIVIDQFSYVSHSDGITENITNGIVRQYSDISTYKKLNGWRKANYTTVSRQTFNFLYNGADLVVDVPVNDNSLVPPVKVFVDGAFILPTAYSVVKGVDSTTVKFINVPALHSNIEIQIISDYASDNGFYTVPHNIAKNPLGKNFSNLTLGTIRNHYSTICQNLLSLTGDINGINNTRDLGNIGVYGELILQQSSPIIFPALFFNQKNFNFIDSVEYAAREYEKYKLLLLNAMTMTEFTYKTTTEILNECVELVNLGKSESSPFYWSDMMATGDSYTQTDYTITPVTNPTFNTVYNYDLTTANYRAINVYLNDVILLANGNDYEIDPLGSKVTVFVNLNVGDVITLREYETTVGNYIPATPTKLGLYPSFKPEKVLDTTYITPTYVIRGHDGSTTVAFNDFRDDVLLEFESRIYNNLKVHKKEIPLEVTDVTPGQFRTTGYSLAEINEILSTSFLSWVGSNNIDYKSQTYNYDNQFTWNYSTSTSRVDGDVLLGNWRGIFTHLYDTDSPHLSPWNMLGFPARPSWWTNVYGLAPYTSGNLVLWQDLEAGRVSDPAGPYTIDKFKRPGLTNYIPVDSLGNLRSPFDILVKNYDRLSLKRSWVFGDHGAAETAWRRSSSWPFAVQRLLALTKPAQYFSLMIDRDRYVHDQKTNQYVFDNGSRISPSLVEVYGNGTAKHSYLNWIVDYNRLSGVDGKDELLLLLKNIDVRLCYQVGGFTDKKYLKVFTEKSSPNVSNGSLMFPDESYQILMYQDPTIQQFVWSSVIIQRTESGFSVFGYSTTHPYFNILRSVSNGVYNKLEYNDNTYFINSTYSDNIVQVPYGHEFLTINSVIDFLVSYGKFLEFNGMQFDTITNNIPLTWMQMAEEFVIWANQGWQEGSVINLNPNATVIKINSPGLVVEPLTTSSSVLLDQNKQPFKSSEYVVERMDNEFILRSLSDRTINYMSVGFTAYEHLIVFDNVSIFNDLMFDPVIGDRQSRVKLIGYVTNDWNGTLDTAGFILNRDNIQDWKANKTYSKGQIVKHKGSYWSALTLIPAIDTFNFEQWLPSDFSKINKGLLPNLALKSDQMMLNYDSKSSNFEEDADLLGLGIIGFRPRRYMQNLNIDDISQVNVYKEFIQSKGTMQSVGIFGKAELGKEIADYNIYENWAVKRATYGASANRNFVEVRLQESNLRANPALLKFTNTEVESFKSTAQYVTVDNIWKSNRKYTNPELFPVIIDNNVDLQLPSAGYVDINDVDLFLFDLTDITLLTENINQITDGSIVWVAKDNKYNWNVYRCVEQPAKIIKVRDTLDGRSIITFSSHHNLNVDDTIIVKFFNNLVDSAYVVKEVVDLKNIIINLRLPSNRSEIIGSGIYFVMQSSRVQQASDIVNLPYVKSIDNGDKIWVNNIGDGKWAVYSKDSPFSYGDTLHPVDDLTTNYQNAYGGSSLAQTSDRTLILSGAPGFSTTGAIYVFQRSGVKYQEAAYKLILNSPGIVDYGHSITIGNSDWAAVGCPSSKATGFSHSQGYVSILKRDDKTRDFSNWQILSVPNGSVSSFEFGYSVSMSSDDRWLYVGAPGANKVYAYNLVDIPAQSVTYAANGTDTEFNTSLHLIVADGTQVGVTVDGNATVYGIDWTWTNGKVVFTVAPANASVIVIFRKNNLLLTPSQGQTQVSTSSLYTATSIDAISVFVNDALLKPYDDYQFNSVTKVLTLTNALNSTDVIVVQAKQYYSYVGTIDNTVVGSLNVADRFGHSITTSSDGREILIGAPGKEIDTQTNSGAVFVINRSFEKFKVFNDTVMNYRPTNVQAGPTTVSINGTYLLDSANYINGTYNKVGNDIVIGNNYQLVVGDVIQVESNKFTLLQILSLGDHVLDITIPGPAGFGQAVDICYKNCSIFVGAPADNTYNVEAGSARVYNNQTSLYGILSTNVNNNIALTTGHSIFINGFEVVLRGPTLTDLVSDINQFASENIRATLVANSGTTSSLIVQVLNSAASKQFEQLLITPGVGTLFSDIGFAPYKHVQTLFADNAVDFANFGSSISVNLSVNSIAISAPRGNARRITTFDNNTTTFNNGTTAIVNVTNRSGIVYTFDLLPSSTASITNPAKFVFGQEIYHSTVEDLSQFGFAVNYKYGQLLVGAPLATLTNLSHSVTNAGNVLAFINADNLPAWNIYHQQHRAVDANLINSIFIYNKDSGKTLSKLDYIDPLNGKILGVAKENIDYISAVDPAAYNIGMVNNYGQYWAEEHVGEIWWNLENCRFVDYQTSDLDFATRNWGNVVTNSQVEVYQWIESNDLPANYSGPGIVYNKSQFVVRGELLNTGVVATKYYFWVRGISSVNLSRSKTLSTVSIEQYITNPKSSGIPFVAAVDPSTLVLYNIQDYVIANDSVLHIEYDEKANDDNVHTEYDIIADGNERSFISDSLYRKLLDSFCGSDSLGNKVPDVTLSEANAYGVNFRPRQSLFVNRFVAIRNYINTTNNILINHPIVESKTFNLLKEEEPIPAISTNQWDYTVNTYDELTYQDLTLINPNTKFLVLSDSTRNGIWTIYTVQTDKSLLLTRVQHYDVNQYWEYVDWYLSGVTYKTKILTEVNRYVDLQTLGSVVNGGIVKVRANSSNKWELYRYDNNEWIRVGLEKGTIQFKSSLYDYNLESVGYDDEVFDVHYYDTEPVTETRNVIRAINEELFVGDLLIHRNNLLLLMFKYIVQEQQNPEWLFKTSLIDVNHNVRELSKYPTYLRDNQDFVVDFISEVKPYHTKIREFNLRYEGVELFDGAITDFDVPAYYNSTSKRFISPILDDKTTPIDEYSSVKSTDNIWNTFPWQSWYNTYNLILDSVDVIFGGTGYTIPPVVKVVGDAKIPAKLEAVINSNGNLSGIVVINPGSRYVSRPTIEITGGNGYGATASAKMRVDLVRSFKSVVKFDRYEYDTSIIDWSPLTYFKVGSLVRYNNTIWTVNSTPGNVDLYSGTIFALSDYTIADVSTLAAADRTMGYYTPTSTQPGKILAQLMSGIDYPGVQVIGLDFNDVSTALDTTYDGSFTDSYLGTRVTDINVDGAQFIDTYSSHAPEELMPGSIFDTLDIKIFSRPGADNNNDGHGWPLYMQSYSYVPGKLIDISDVIDFPYSYNVVNINEHRWLTPDVDYTINWVNKSLTIISGCTVGDKVGVIGVGIGGGNQLYQNTYIGDSVGNNITVPVSIADIHELAISINGIIVNNYSLTQVNNVGTKVTFTTTYTSTDFIVLTVFGKESTQHSYSLFTTNRYTYNNTPITLTGNLSGTNAIHAIVNANGVRLQPPDSIKYTSIGGIVEFYLPTNAEISQGLINDSDVRVYVNNQAKVLNTDYTISGWDGSSDRYIIFNVAPAAGSEIIVAVTTNSGYNIINNVLTISQSVLSGSVITVTTFNDTSQLDLLTQVFVGPIEQGSFVATPYDSTVFDDSMVEYDNTVGRIEYINRFDTGRNKIDATRTFVSLNGRHLMPNDEFIVSGSTVLIAGPGLNSSDIIAITSVTTSIVPKPLLMRIMQDMRGSQRIYRAINSTTLAQNLTLTDDIIYFKDVSALAIPAADLNVFNILGSVIIGSEKITYRHIDLVNNTVSGLRRGVSGTAISNHSINDVAYDVGVGEQIPTEYQQAKQTSSYLGDGTTTLYTTTLSVPTMTGSLVGMEHRAVQVYVGGTLVDSSNYTVISTAPVVVDFATAVDVGVEIKIVLTVGYVMYDLTNTSLSLQNQTNAVVKFLTNTV